MGGILFGVLGLSFLFGVLGLSFRKEAAAAVDIKPSLARYPSSFSVPSFVYDAPRNRTVDVNIGTNYSPMPLTAGHFLLLVDPLPAVCEFLSTKYRANSDVAVLCCAVSNHTGSATFLHYGGGKGASSSLASTATGTSHGRIRIREKNTVIVLEAAQVIGGLLTNHNSIFKLKTDMQGYDLTALRNLREILSMPNQMVHLKSECFIPNAQGKQIYQIDNACEEMRIYLETLGNWVAF